jgi:hypothetical protein
MRAVLAVSLVVLIAPVAGLAQTAPAPSATPTPSTTPAPSAAPARGGVTRDQYIERAVERARRAAEKRFDKLDANHDGVLSVEERRAGRAERAQGRAAPSQ